MDENEVRRILEDALRRLAADDRHLLENDLSERCIASRLAMYLQPEFRGWSVDVEYNRAGDVAKRVALPDECTKRRNRDGDSIAVPDVIVHRRGTAGPNLLVVELKKTSNPAHFDCDRIRIHEFRGRLGYEFGALVECETRKGRNPAAGIAEWIAG